MHNFFDRTEKAVRKGLAERVEAIGKDADLSSSRNGH